MALTPGSRIGSYEIAEQIGVGGMGEVYRATDTKLKRQVAIKVLPAALAGDAERLARFQREAEVLASLNHPNIATIHGLEDADGSKALVMELVEGPTLADRIAQGPVPVDEALTIAKQIAEALEAAHEQSIIHRDLKPANVKVRPDGTVKVLDFGLAKAMEPAGVMSASQSMSPTITTPAMTQAGLILGTAAYMSPEQARGKPVDRRADIWAFGCVLFEMLTGKRAFDGEDVTDTLVALIGTEPRWSELPLLPPGVARMMRLCLVKDPTRRLRDIGEARLAIDGERKAPSVEHEERPEGRRRSRQVTMPLLLLLVAVPLTVLVTKGLTSPSIPLVARSVIPVDGSRQLDSVRGNPLAFSRDGRTLVYAASSELLVRNIGEFEALSLQGVGEEPRQPFLSPDGMWIGYLNGPLAVMKIAVSGGSAAALAENVQIRGATWMDDGRVVYVGEGGLEAVPEDGGDSVLFTTVDAAAGEEAHLWPHALPDGRGVLFTIQSLNGNLETSQIAVFDSGTKSVRVILRGGHDAQYVRTGHLVYGMAGELRAVPFDLDRLEVTGTPVRLLDRVATTSTGGVSAAISDSGTLAYVTGGLLNTQGVRSLVWVTRAGREDTVAVPPRGYLYPRLSPDGSQVALDVRGEDPGIWILDLARQSLRQFTLGLEAGLWPVWTDEGRRIAFSRGTGAEQRVYVQASDGTGVAEALGAIRGTPSSVDPTGAGLIVRTNAGGSDGLDLSLMDLSQDVPGGRNAVTSVVSGRGDQQNGEVSPDGRWLAYQSNESGRSEVYVVTLPDVTGGRWRISSEGGRTPLWSRSGNEVFFRSLEGAVMGVHVVDGPSWEASTPSLILPVRYYDTSGGGGRTFDVSSDGQRFLMLKTLDELDATLDRVFVVQNWFTELERLVPVE